MNEPHAVDTLHRHRGRGFTCLFLIEMWERFGFYGMQVLIVIFLSEYLGFDDQHAYLTWGAFAMMIHTTPIIGGWIGDRVLGTRRTTMLGAIVLAIGYLLLALPMPTWFIFFSFGVIAVGNGLFKANPNNLLSQLYEDDRSKLDAAFTIYYMAINLGAFASQLLTPIIRVHYGWHMAFGVSVIGLALGITNFFFMKKYLAHVGSKPDFEKPSIPRFGIVIAGSLAAAVLIAVIIYNIWIARYVVLAAVAALIGVFLYLIVQRGIGERKGLIATMILTLQGLLFFVFYQQMSTSLTLFAKRNVTLYFLGYHMPPEQFQALNPFWIWILSPILAFLYNRLGKHDNDLNIATKFAFGFVMLAIGFFIYGVSGHIQGGNTISPWWMVGGYFFQSFGELLISGLGLAMVARFVVPELRGMIMGGWLLTTGISQFFGSMIANVASVPDSVRGVTKLFPATDRNRLAHLPVAIAHGIDGLKLGAFRYWLDGNPVHASALKNASAVLQQRFVDFSKPVQQTLRQLPAISDLSPTTQQTLHQLNHAFYQTTMTLYTNLFLVLGLAAVVIALISFGLVPYLKRLSADAAAFTPNS